MSIISFVRKQFILYNKFFKMAEEFNRLLCDTSFTLLHVIIRLCMIRKTDRIKNRQDKKQTEQENRKLKKGEQKMDFAKMIDHTMLKADATTQTVRRYCDEAKEFGFASVCVNSCHAALVSKELKGSGVRTCCVVGFPLGAMSTEAKAFEAKQAVKDGAEEIDMVLNIGAMKDRNWDFAANDIHAVVEASRPSIVKVIIETCLLTDEEKVKACELSEKEGAAFVKTSTGFSTGGATVEDVRLMKKTVGNRLKVKASGGIRTPEFAAALADAGADRLGVGNGLPIIGKS